MPRSAWLLALVAVSATACARRPAPEAAPAPDAAPTISTPIVARPPGPAAAAPASQRVRVLVAGDLIPHRPSLAAPSAIQAALAPLLPLFGQADAVVANYEAATGDLEKRAFRLAYAAPPSFLAALPEAGISAVSIANNHACDLGYEGVEATLAAAEKGGVIALGGDAKGDPWHPRVLAEKDGKRVCAIAWTTLVNAEGGCARTVRLAVAPEGNAGRLKVAAAFQRARATCDATIAIIHGGVEYVPQTPAVMATARQAADSGADAVVVHHPHVASPVVVHATHDGRNVPIFASVGNLVSNQGESWKAPMFPVLRDNRRLVCVNGWTRLGVLADLSFDFGVAASGDAAPPPRLDWSFHLLWTENPHADDRAPNPRITTRLLDPTADAAIVARLEEDALGPNDLFDDPCWVERPIFTEGDREPHARCGSGLLRPGADPSSRAKTASRSKKRR